MLLSYSPHIPFNSTIALVASGKSIARSETEIWRVHFLKEIIPTQNDEIKISSCGTAINKKRVTSFHGRTAVVVVNVRVCLIGWLVDWNVSDCNIYIFLVIGCFFVWFSEIEWFELRFICLTLWNNNVCYNYMIRKSISWWTHSYVHTYIHTCTYTHKCLICMFDYSLY